jgi:hypothetical protein
MPKKATRPGARKNVFKATFTRFATTRFATTRFATKRGARFGDWRKILMHRFGPGSLIGTPDPVSLAIFAIDRVGPAAVRACASGVEVRVAAPDEATAAVFRAALAETARRRATDQLVRIVVDENQARGEGRGPGRGAQETRPHYLTGWSRA